MTCQTLLLFPRTNWTTCPFLQICPRQQQQLLAFGSGSAWPGLQLGKGGCDGRRWDKRRHPEYSCSGDAAGRTFLYFCVVHVLGARAVLQAREINPLGYPGFLFSPLSQSLAAQMCDFF